MKANLWGHLVISTWWKFPFSENVSLENSSASHHVSWVRRWCFWDMIFTKTLRIMDSVVSRVIQGIMDNLGNTSQYGNGIFTYFQVIHLHPWDWIIYIYIYLPIMNVNLGDLWNKSLSWMFFGPFWGPGFPYCSLYTFWGDQPAGWSL